MPGRYYEVIFTGRQLAGFLIVLVVLLLSAFGLGVAIRLVEPEVVQSASSTVTTTPLATPLAVPLATPPPPTLIPTPEATPTPPVPAELTPTPPPPPATATPPPPLPSATETPELRREPSPVGVALEEGVWVQVAAVSRRDLAEGVKQRVIAFGFKPEQLRVVATTQGLFKVRLGPFPDLESAGRVVARLQEGGFERPFVIKK